MKRDYFVTNGGTVDETEEGIIAKIMGKYSLEMGAYEEEGPLVLRPCGAEEQGLYNVYIGHILIDTINYELLPAPTQVWVLDIRAYNGDERTFKSCYAKLKDVFFHILNEYGGADTAIQIDRTENKLIQGEMYNISGISIDTGELIYEGTLSLVELN